MEGRSLKEGAVSGTMAIEPLYSLAVACELIPMPTMASLYIFLSKHPNEFPGRYRRHGGPHIARRGFETRLLTESEILKIREMTILNKNPRSTGRHVGVIGSIMRRAMAGG